MEHTQILLAQLAKYEVAFIANAIADAEVNQASSASASLAPAELLAALCDHPEARMKMAMIALLLRQLSFGQYVPDAFMLVKNKAYFCYVTPAFYLQQLYQHELTRYFGAQPCLQNWFAALFQTSPNASAEQGLQTVAVQQAHWINPFTNWLGGYKHVAQRMLRHAAFIQTCAN